MYTHDQVKSIQIECLVAVGCWAMHRYDNDAPGWKWHSHFAWPFDFLDQRHPWTYYVIAASEEAWNEEGRETPSEKFYRSWCADYTNVFVAVNGAQEADEESGS